MADNNFRVEINSLVFYPNLTGNSVAGVICRRILTKYAVAEHNLCFVYVYLVKAPPAVVTLAAHKCTRPLL